MLGCFALSTHYESRLLAQTTFPPPSAAVDIYTLMRDRRCWSACLDAANDEESQESIGREASGHIDQHGQTSGNNNRGRWKKAEELFVQVMETFERLLRPEHLNTQISIDNLALTVRHQHRNREALGAQRCEQVQEERDIH